MINAGDLDQALHGVARQIKEVLPVCGCAWMRCECVGAGVRVNRRKSVARVRLHCAHVFTGVRMFVGVLGRAGGGRGGGGGKKKKKKCRNGKPVL